MQTNLDAFDFEMQILQPDEQIKIYLKCKETGELTDCNPSDPAFGGVPEGYTLVKRICKKRSIKLLMEKFRAAVEIAKIIGKERKLEREREENAKGGCGCDKGSEVEGNEEQQV